MGAAPSTTASLRWVRRRRDAIAVVVGVAVLVLGMLIVRNGTVSGLEKWVFERINGLPDALNPVLWPAQQVGVLVVGGVVALVAAVLRRYRLALAALFVTVGKLVTERIVKAMVSRQRPGSSIGPDINARGNVHLVGESFVSGHALLVAALAGVIAPYLSGRWRYAPWIVVVFVAVGRVYAGAHNPLDVVCGAALGVALAGLANLIVGVPARAGTEATPAHSDSDEVAPLE